MYNLQKMEQVLLTKLPLELVELIMEIVHKLNLQEVHKSLREVQYGVVFRDLLTFDAKWLIHTNNSNRVHINGIVIGYPLDDTLYSNLIFMHKLKYLDQY